MTNTAEHDRPQIMYVLHTAWSQPRSDLQAGNYGRFKSMQLLYLIFMAL